MKQLKPAYRLKLFFVASAILRQSKSRRGERDKYGELGGGRQAATLASRVQPRFAVPHTGVKAGRWPLTAAAT